MNENYRDWTEAEVQEWLQNIRGGLFKEYRESFEGFEGRDLIELSQDQVVEIVRHAGRAILLYKAIQNLHDTSRIAAGLDVASHGNGIREFGGLRVAGSGNNVNLHNVHITPGRDGTTCVSADRITQVQQTLQDGLDAHNRTHGIMDEATAGYGSGHQNRTEVYIKCEICPRKVKPTKWTIFAKWRTNHLRSNQHCVAYESLHQ